MSQTPASVRHLTYPVVTTAACLLFTVMADSEVPTVITAYVVVLIALVAIVFSEWKWPFRSSWRPDRGAFTSDAAFAVTVQMALPTLLSIGAALIFSDVANGSWSGLRDYWPHSLPPTIQVVLMVLIADLLRYPLHRAMHASPALWRLHAVHHSPGRLYWLNVGRFHPLEKSLQWMVDALPFVMVGVSDRVLAGYFVFYAVNGFFQHSNCDVELGPLNYVISGPELHRWHHSIETEESNTNYGNNVIIWDALFGTRALPRGRDVEMLGNRIPDYPQGFVESLRRPFA